MTALLTVSIDHRLSREAYRRRIALAWADLRLRHVMLMSRTRYETQEKQRKFIVDIHEGQEEVFNDVMQHITWVEDYYQEVDGLEIHRHALNVGRIIEPDKCLSRLYVLPLLKLPNGKYELRFLILMAHQISDGLSAYNWFSDFIRILNLPEMDLEKEIGVFCREEEIKSRLPPAQEDLYPQDKGTKARERWFWAIIRVLRHLRKTTPRSFTNPLMRERRLEETVSCTPVFDKIFDYSDANKPPLNSGHVGAKLSRQASEHMIDLCRSIRISIGAGCFALAGLAMMAIHEDRYPNIPDNERLPFVASFPLNPRAFFGFNTPADSCMLAFSEGIVMPFLPSSLPIEGRFKLIAAHANRALRMYQKRAKGNLTGLLGPLNPHDPARILANAYISAIERSDARLPKDMKFGVQPQGSLEPPAFQFRATCGVSSIGSTVQWLAPGRYSLSRIGNGEDTQDFVADFRDFRQGVRARDDEFLVGSSSDAEGCIRFGVSFDESAISSEMAERWRYVVENLMEGSARRAGEARI